MRRAIEAVLAVLIAALALPAPAVSFLALPPGPSAGDVSAARTAFMAATWDALPISQTMDRPSTVYEEPLSQGDWDADFTLCARKLPNIDSISWGDHGVFYDATAGASFDEATQLALFHCAVVHPRDFADSESGVRSAAQLDYTYDHYRRWLLPCLAANGFGYGQPPTRDEFFELGGNWSPYTEGLVGPDGRPAEFDRALHQCGQDALGLR